MDRNKNFFSFSEFISANPDKNLNSIDYLHAIFKLSNLHDDLIYSFMDLFFPKFKIINNLVFLEECFDIDTYKKYQDEGKENSEIQLWINLLEITGIFENLDEESALKMSNTIAKIWNLKLEREHNDALGRARAIHDKELGEVFVTIDQSIK